MSQKCVKAVSAVVGQSFRPRGGIVCTGGNTVRGGSCRTATWYNPTLILAIYGRQSYQNRRGFVFIKAFIAGKYQFVLCDTLTPMNGRRTLVQLSIAFAVIWIGFVLFGVQIEWGHHMRLSGILIGTAVIALVPPVLVYLLLHLASSIFRAVKPGAQI
jgi:hypothetical protein